MGLKSEFHIYTYIPSFILHKVKAITTTKNLLFFYFYLLLVLSLLWIYFFFLSLCNKTHAFNKEMNMMQFKMVISFIYVLTWVISGGIYSSRETHTHTSQKKWNWEQMKNTDCTFVQYYRSINNCWNVRNTKKNYEKSIFNKSKMKNFCFFCVGPE